MVSPLRPRRVKGVSVFYVYPATCILGRMTASFTCHCDNTGVERTPNKSQHRNLTVEKKALPPLLPGLELTTFRSQVGRSTNKLSLNRIPPPRIGLNSVALAEKSAFFSLVQLDSVAHFLSLSLLVLLCFSLSLLFHIPTTNSECRVCIYTSRILLTGIDYPTSSP